MISRIRKKTTFQTAVENTAKSYGSAKTGDLLATALTGEGLPVSATNVMGEGALGTFAPELNAVYNASKVAAVTDAIGAAVTTTEAVAITGGAAVASLGGMVAGAVARKLVENEYEFNVDEHNQTVGLKDVTDINQIYRDYHFTFTSADIVYFNREYARAGVPPPFDDTTTTPSVNTNVDINTSELLRFYEYAHDAYNDEHMRDSKLLVEGNSEVRITVNDDSNEVVVAFRGSTTYEDFRDDLNVTSELASNLGWIGVDGSTDCLVHVGFNDYVVRLNRDVADYLRRYPSYDVYVCGHSLGSISATIFSYRM
jgi:hypothetical protein